MTKRELESWMVQTLGLKKLPYIQENLIYNWKKLRNCFYKQDEHLTVHNNGLKSFKRTEKLFILFSKTGFGFC